MGAVRWETESRILVLEEQRTVRRVFQLILGDAGFRVGVASTTEEAVEALSDGEYTLLIVDTAMAGEERRELLDVLRREHPMLATLIVSGEPGALAAAHEHPNVDAVATKPVRREQLLESVEAASLARLQRSGTRLRRAPLP